jgi:prolyl-tRNA synthetase
MNNERITQMALIVVWGILLFTLILVGLFVVGSNTSDNDQARAQVAKVQACGKLSTEKDRIACLAGWPMSPAIQKFAAQNELKAAAVCIKGDEDDVVNYSVCMEQFGYHGS